MTAREAISPVRGSGAAVPPCRVEGGMHLLDVLPRLLDAPGRELAVDLNGKDEGIIDQTSMLEAMGRLIAPRYDCSVIELDCAPADYSASSLARAVEDSDVHLVDLLTSPGEEGRLHVTLRVRCQDPTGTVHCLERYGYEVGCVHPGGDATLLVDMERLRALQTLMNV